MTEHEKKKTHDDLPAVHKPPKPLGMAGREPSSKAAVEHHELERLTERLRNARDPHERTALIAAIEHQFGSSVADQVLRKLGTPRRAGGHG